MELVPTNQPARPLRAERHQGHGGVVILFSRDIDPNAVVRVERGSRKVLVPSETRIERTGTSGLQYPPAFLREDVEPLVHCHTWSGHHSVIRSPQSSGG